MKSSPLTTAADSLESGSIEPSDNSVSSHPSAKSFGLATSSTFEISPDVNNNVVIVDIDEKSIEKLGQFPWRRDIYSNILSNLKSAGASVIAFDIFFSEDDKQNPVTILEEFEIIYNQENIINSDQIFLRSIKENNVILPLVGATKETKKNNFTIKSNIIIRGERSFRLFV